MLPCFIMPALPDAKHFQEVNGQQQEAFGALPGLSNVEGNRDPPVNVPDVPVMAPPTSSEEPDAGKRRPKRRKRAKKDSSGTLLEGS